MMRLTEELCKFTTFKIKKKWEVLPNGWAQDWGLPLEGQ